MSDDIKARIAAIIAEVAEIDDVPEGKTFSDLGIDSMMAIEIVAEVEREFDVKINEDELVELTDLTAVFNKVKERLGA